MIDGDGPSAIGPSAAPFLSSRLDAVRCVLQVVQGRARADSAWPITIDHQCLRAVPLGSQFRQHSGEDALFAPTPLTIVEGIWRAILGRRVPPSQPIAIDEENPAQQTPVIDARLALGLSEEGAEKLYLRLRQLEKIRYVAARFSNSESRCYLPINGS